MASQEESAKAVVGRFLREPVDGGATVRLAVPLPNVSLLTPGIVALARLMNYIGSRRTVRRRAHLPRQFFLAVTPTRVAALRLSYGTSVRVRRLVASWEKRGVQIARDDRSGWLALRLPDRQPVLLELVIPGVEDELLRHFA